MTVQGYNQFGGFLLTIPIPAFTEAASMFPLDYAGVSGISPYFSSGWYLKKLVFIGSVTAAGTGVSVSCTATRGRADDTGNDVFTATSPVSDSAQNFKAESSTIVNEGKHIFSVTDEMGIRAQIAAGDTVTYAGGMAIIYGEFY